MRWSDPAMLLAAGVAAATVSAIGTAWARRHALRRGLLDQPGPRRSHRVATPRGGGIGIVVACLACVVVQALHGSAAASSWLIAAGLVLVAGVGWLDDHRALPALPRLVVHVLAAALVGFALYRSGAGWPASAAGFVLVLGMVNAWNFMDGINGLAASQALLAGLALALIPAGASPMLAIVLAGACLGFLPFNFPRASVFLGDVGSGALGYLVAVLVASRFASTAQTDWPLLLLAPLAMLTDSGLTLLRRIARGERWWQAHVDHAYQRWSARSGHVLVTLAFAVWTLMAIAVMLPTLGRVGDVGYLVFLGCALATGLAWWWLQQRHAGKTEGFGS